MVTNGSMEAGGAALPLHDRAGRPGDRRAALLRPHAAAARQRTGVELVPVPLEADGVDIEAFERALADGPVKFAHVIPNFHNPAGCTLSAEKRERLVELAAEHGFTIFEDDPYRLICRSGATRRRRCSRRTGPTASSTLRRSRRRSAPGSGSATWPVRPTRSRRSPSAATSTTSRRTCSPSRSCSSSAARAALEREHRVRQRGAARAPRRARRGASRADPRGRVRRPGRRLLPLADLDDDVDTAELLAAAKEEGVAFVAGPDFMLEGGRSSLRLSFASVPADEIGGGRRPDRPGARARARRAARA